MAPIPVLGTWLDWHFLSDSYARNVAHFTFWLDTKAMCNSTASPMVRNPSQHPSPSTRQSKWPGCRDYQDNDVVQCCFGFIVSQQCLMEISGPKGVFVSVVLFWRWPFWKSVGVADHQITSALMCSTVKFQSLKKLSNMWYMWMDMSMSCHAMYVRMCSWHYSWPHFFSTQ